MRKHTLFLPLAGLLCLLLLFACGGEGSSAPPADAASAAPPPVPAPAASGGKTYPSISLDRLEYLWNNADYMDVVFYNMNISLNQSTQNQVRATIAHVSADAPTSIPPECQSIGRIFFQVQGKNVEMAEIYFQQGCTFYLWLEDEKPAYANTLTEAGIGFYNNIFEQARQAGLSN